MTFVETMENLKFFIDELEGREYLGKMRDTFIKVIYEMERQFSFMEKSDNKPLVDQLLIEDIFRTFDYIQDRYITVIISNKIYKFVKTYLLLINNWNNNVTCNDQIKNRILFLDCIYDNHMTVIESFNILKTLIRRCESLQSFALPSVELSRHYLNALDREIERK